MKESLGLSASQVNLVFENMSDGVLLVDREGIIRYANSALFELFQLDEERALNGLSFEASFLEQKRNKDFNNLFLKAMEDGLPRESAEIDYTLQKGKRLHLVVEIRQVMDSDNDDTTFSGMLILFQNASDRHSLMQTHRDSANIFTALILGISIYLGAWSLCKFTLKMPFTTADYTLMIEGITFFLFLEILLFTSLKLKDVGLVPNKARIKKNILSTFMVGVAGFGILLIIRVLVIKYGLPGKSYFIGGSKAGIERYFFTAVLQEFLSRGVMQTSVKYLLQIRFQKPIAIVVTSLLFAIMHLPYGFPFMVGAFALSVALGILYEYQEDMWGCALLHWLLGYLAMALFF